MLEDILGGLGSNFNLDLSFLIWPIISTVVIIALIAILRMIIKNSNKRKEKEEMNAYMELLFEKYSDIIVERVVEKLNNTNTANNNTNNQKSIN